ncbi:MAG: glutamine synthetase family protein [Promethearchaeota archaeon]
MDIELLRKTWASEVKFIQFQFTNILGQLKGVELPASSLVNVNKIGIDASSVGLAPTKKSDLVLWPDISTFYLLPWVSQSNVCAIMCEVHELDTNKLDADPRSILRRTLEKIHDEMGLFYRTRPELEFYLLKEDFIPFDNAGYMSLPPIDKGSLLRREIVDKMSYFELFAKTLHSECGPGQNEVEFEFNDAMKSADGLQFTKQLVRMLAPKYNARVTFMPKPFADAAGSGLHIHQIVCNTEGENIFCKKDGGLSKEAEYFVGGLLNYVDEILAFCCPTINSYKRLVVGHEAPVYKTWGIGNRTALIRVPGYESGRLEFRVGDPSMNIYLVLALLLAAGVEGIKNQIEPPEPSTVDLDSYTKEQLIEMNVELLPKTLEEAIKKAETSSFVKQIISSDLLEIFVRTKKEEIDSFKKEVGEFNSEKIEPWEIKHYG